MLTPLFQSLDKIKEQSALISAQIKNNKYHWIIDVLSVNKINNDIREAPMPMGKKTIKNNNKLMKSQRLIKTFHNSHTKSVLYQFQKPNPIHWQV